MADLDFKCEFTEPETLSQFLKAGRHCKVTGEMCWNWNKPQAKMCSYAEMWKRKQVIQPPKKEET